MSDGIGGAPAEAEDPRADLIWETVPRLVEDAATRHASTEALVDGDLRLTYEQLAPEVDRYARGFVAAGLDVGDRVGIWGPNCAEWMLAALGVLRSGGVIVPLNTRFKGGEAAYILRNSGAKLLVTVRGFLGFDYPAMLGDEDVCQLTQIVLLRDEGNDGTGEQRPPAPIVALADFLVAGERVQPETTRARTAALQPTDVSDLIFTSGTTGHPKGAVTTHAQSLRTFGTWASIVGLGAGDRYLIVNPFFHTFGYKAGFLACLMAGATVVPEPVFDAGAVLRRIEEERISVLPGPPTLYQTLLGDSDRGKHDLSSLRLGVTGAAVVPVELVRAMGDDLGFTTVLTAYGLTESCGTVTMCRRSDPPEIVAHTSGRAIPGLEVRVVADGKEVPAGEPGEIVVRGYTVMSGYWGNPEATAEAIDTDGWLHTGDIGVMDAHGNVTITDRVKDMYVVGGFNAYPAEIEAILRGHEAVAQVAVVGVPDLRMGEVGCAYIVPVGGALAGDSEAEADDLGRSILSWSRDSMANYKVPRGIVLVDALPVNASGKVLKRELRDRHASGADRVVAIERSE
jgi:acyl-CoA synthetase (AMP-forming)/AMP-acid ligase II